jgi:hypothetical protein
VPQKLLSVDEAIAESLRQEREHRTIARWTDGVFALRGFRHDHAYYSKRATGVAVARATPFALWLWVMHIGGPQSLLLHELAVVAPRDHGLAGGWSGLFPRASRHADLRLGDVIDYWTVLAIEPERSTDAALRPQGTGLRRPRVPDHSRRCEHTQLRITAHWHPRGVWGLMYWYAMLPAHLFLFRGWTRKLARLAEAAHGCGRERSGPANCDVPRSHAR